MGGVGLPFESVVTRYTLSIRRYKYILSIRIIQNYNDLQRKVFVQFHRCGGQSVLNIQDSHTFWGWFNTRAWKLLRAFLLLWRMFLV